MEMLVPENLKDLESGKTVPAKTENSAPRPEIPPWFDREKFERGRKFYSDHLLSIIFANLLSLLVGFTVETFQNVLTATRETDGAKKAMYRYSSTLHHIFVWHTTNIFDPSSKGHRSLHFVRNWHNAVREKQETTENTPLMNQYDFSLVQAGFVGPILMYPLDVGINCSEEDLDDYVYLWRVIGYCLAIDDPFNVCAGGLESARNICREITQEIIVPGLAQPSPQYEKLAQDLLNGVANPLLEREILYAYVFPSMGLPKPTLSWSQYARYIILSLLIWLRTRSNWYRKFVNARVRAFIEKTMLV